MSDAAATKRMTIFVHRASELLTDHESHGDGLICFSLLSGLARRGHKIFAFSDRVAISDSVDNLVTKSLPLKTPSYAFAPYERAMQADKWLREIERREKVDVVWRMHPYNGNGCPTLPYTGGRPLVTGPLFYEWPKNLVSQNSNGKPRFGFGIGSLLRPIGDNGWQKTLAASSLILCATDAHANKIKALGVEGKVASLPVIVETSFKPISRPFDRSKLKFAFVGNLVEQKHPSVFCDIIIGLCKKGIDTEGVVVGDGPERSALEVHCKSSPYGSNIIFLGKVPNSDVIPIVGNCDALISTSNGEPYGRGIVEAMAAGTPAICHKSGGPADFIVDGENGLLVDELSPEAYVNVIKKANEYAEMWPRLSSGALRSASHWHEDCILDRLESELLFLC